jgi:hypothetical protein
VNYDSKALSSAPVRRCGALRISRRDPGVDLLGAAFLDLPGSRAPSAGPNPAGARAHRLLAAALTTLLCSALVALTGAVSASAVECPNEAIRAQQGATFLPECRAYELVVPRKVNGFPFAGVTTTTFKNWDTPSAFEGRYFWSMFPGGLPDTESGGEFNTYEARRTEDGWVSVRKSPTPIEAVAPDAQGYSADGEYMDFHIEAGSRPGGTLAPEAQPYAYTRYPDGSFQLTGEGTVPTAEDTDGYPNGLIDDPDVITRYLSAGGTHQLFEGRAELLQGAPSNTQVYDRTPAGLQMISLLPGDAMPSSESSFRGTSADGSTTLFENKKNLYVRLEDTATHLVAANTPVGNKATCNAIGSLEGGAIGYQWLRNGAPIAGATDPTYTFQAGDAGAAIQCQSTATTANAGSTRVSSGRVVVSPEPAVEPPTAPYVGAPTISTDGSLAVGSDPTSTSPPTTLTCDPSEAGWSRVTGPFSYSWYRNGVLLSGNGATTDTYSVQEADVATAAVFQCAVSGSNAGGTIVRVSDNLGTSPAPSPPAPTIFDAQLTVEQNTLVPAGIVADGSILFYIESGDVYRYHTATQTAEQWTDTGDSNVVKIAPDGSLAYFISERELAGGATPDKPNLYVTDGNDVQFIGTLEEEDLLRGDAEPHQGLSTWSEGREADSQGAENLQAGLGTARVTPDGKIFVFESKAQLTDYPNAGYFELYRYDTTTEALTCISCSATEIAASGESNFDRGLVGGGIPPSAGLIFPNIVDSAGNQIVFESNAALVPQDTNGLRDVYEWRDGTLYLISTGHSPQASNLYGIAPGGRDIYFLTGEKLVAQGQQPGALSIYDARVDGGLASQGPQDSANCEGEACLAAPNVAPTLGSPTSSAIEGGGNVKPRCRAKRRRHRKHGHHRGHRHEQPRPRAGKHRTKARPCKSARGRTGK